MNFFENTPLLFSPCFSCVSASFAAALLVSSKKKNSDGAQGGSSDTDSKFRTLDDIKRQAINIGVFKGQGSFGLR